MSTNIEEAYNPTDLERELQRLGDNLDTQTPVAVSSLEKTVSDTWEVDEDKDISPSESENEEPMSVQPLSVDTYYLNS